MIAKIFNVISDVFYSIIWGMFNIYCWLGHKNEISHRSSKCSAFVLSSHELKNSVGLSTVQPFMNSNFHFLVVELKPSQEFLQWPKWPDMRCDSSTWHFSLAQQLFHWELWTIHPIVWATKATLGRLLIL